MPLNYKTKVCFKFRMQDIKLSPRRSRAYIKEKNYIILTQVINLSLGRLQTLHHNLPRPLVQTKI